MGAYINPEFETKELFLEREGRKITFEEAKEFDFQNNELVVIYVYMLSHTAAVIAFEERELKMLTSTHLEDKRNREYYLIDKDKLYEVSNLDYYLPKG